MRMVDINVHGVIHGMKIALPRMMARNRGHVVNIASQAGKYGAPGGATYSATKHAVIGLTEAVRGELHIEGSAVELSYVMPFVVRTELGAGTEERAGDEEARARRRGRRDRRCAQARRRRRVGAALQPATPIASAALLPRRASEGMARAMKADRVLMGADMHARAAYEVRAANSEPGLEPGEEPRQLTS